MTTLQQALQEFQAQLQKGVIQQAYQGLMQYILYLRGRLKERFPDYPMPGSLYTGYMDMTYFSILPPALRERGLKIAVVFVYETFRFEVWLAAVNKQVQAKTLQAIGESGWDAGPYRVVPTVKGYDSIVEHAAVEDPDFSDLDGLTAKIEAEVARFIADMERLVGEV